MSGKRGLQAGDLERAAAHGLDEATLFRQLDFLDRPPPSISLDRACHIDDGILRITEGEIPELLSAHREAASTGRTGYFVPASGAATRMFKSLARLRDEGCPERAVLEKSPDADARETLKFFAGVERFAFRDDLRATLAARDHVLANCLERGAVQPLLEALLDAEGLDYAHTPKGLLPFHRYPTGARTAFEEHLVESIGLAADARGRTRLHFTVSPQHRDAFDTRLRQSRATIEPMFSASLEVGFSTQKSSTDTIAVDMDGRPFRDGDGELLFRPGGHGSLIANLADLARDGADLLFVKNIDNVVHQDFRETVLRWRRILAGSLVRLQSRLFSARRDLDDPTDRAAAVSRARGVLRAELGIDVAGADDDLDHAVALLRARLDRPTRVCAVLRAEGDPGGGPFWVREADGTTSRQIVETAQIDTGTPDQRDAQAGATHFSPADMVLGLRDYRGEPFDLWKYVDHEAVFVATKSSGGRPLRALEHPGLWNGGMADWNTLFVEVPPEIFQPVKTLTDLLGRAHQPAAEL